jgi:hypothetical protein
MAWMAANHSLEFQPRSNRFSRLLIKNTVPEPRTSGILRRDADAGGEVAVGAEK